MLQGEASLSKVSWYNRNFTGFQGGTPFSRLQDESSTQEGFSGKRYFTRHRENRHLFKSPLINTSRIGLPWKQPLHH